MKTMQAFDNVLRAIEKVRNSLNNLYYSLIALIGIHFISLIIYLLTK